MTVKSKARDAKLRAQIAEHEERKQQGTKRPSLYGVATPAEVVDPSQVLLDEIRRTAGHIEWLSMQIELSDPEAFTRSLWLLKRQSGYVKESEIDTSSMSEAGAMWLELYLTERRHLATICRTALAAGIEERRVRIAERQAESIANAFRGMLFDLGDLVGFAIDPEDDNVRALIFKHLMTAAGAPQPKANKNLPLAIDDGEN